MPTVEVRNIRDAKSLFHSTYVAALKGSVYFYHNHSYTWLHCLFAVFFAWLTSICSNTDTKKSHLFTIYTSRLHDLKDFKSHFCKEFIQEA